MKEIGIEMTCAMSARRGGIGTYAVELLKALSACNTNDPHFHFNSLYKLSRIKHSGLRYRQTGIPAYWHGLGLPIKRFDLVHCTDSQFFRSGSSPVIITIHDLAIFKKPYCDIPGYTTAEFRRVMFDRMNQMIKNCDGIICVSKCTAQDLEILFPNHGKQVTVTYLGVRSDLNKAPLKERTNTRPYLLFAGLVSIRKNILGLLRGFHAAGLQKEFDLILAGEKGMGWEEIEKEMIALGLQDAVKITGYLHDSELTYYYRHASAVCMCTYYEGFGLPALEAMSMGIPVLIGMYGALPEVCGDHAIQCDPFSTESIAAGLKAVLNTTPGQWTGGLEFARQYTWERCAQQTLTFYSSFCGGK